MSMSVPLPLDYDGFLRRECPHCEREFKWHNGPATADAEEAEVPTTYYCPLCGDSAAPDEWWTPAQLEYMRDVATPMIMQQVEDSIADALRGSKHLSVRPGNDTYPDGPDALTEPDDMRIVASPCHDYEPVKVPDDTTGPLHCLICGSQYAV